MRTTDFDFLPGVWQVTNHRLVDASDPDCEEWREYPATVEARLILGGAGNLEHFLTDGGNYEGFTLRMFDPEHDLWRIWWASTDRPGRLDPPVEGRFDSDGVGRFECDDILDGVPVRVRFTWSQIAASSARWEQHFSFDGGANWKSNWVMLFQR